jgi:hypothetical protein
MTVKSLTVRVAASAVAVLAASSLAGCSAPPPPDPSPRHMLTGQLIVADLTVGIPACDPWRTFADSLSDLQGGTQLPCPKALPSPYSGAAPGAAVTVTSATGKLLGTGRLNNGVLSLHGVRYPFTVADLPSTDTYMVKVSTVTSATYTKATLETDGWIVELSVGHKAQQHT